jgi:SAM-dependent methyltransferase
MRQVEAGSYDAVTFLLSIQDIDPLDAVLRNAGDSLRPGGRMVFLMTHPCFRIPRQSGWGWDEGRRLRYRRVDRYLTPLTVPMKVYGAGRRGATRSHHRPLQDYVEELTKFGLVVEKLREFPGPSGAVARRRHSTAERAANREIPLFLGLCALKLG